MMKRTKIRQSILLNPTKIDDDALPLFEHDDNILSDPVYERIITCHSITSCLDFLDLLAAILALTFLLLTGIVLLGIPWPRSGKGYSHFFNETFHLMCTQDSTHFPSVHSPKNDLLS